jgi:hypothetical protein
LCATILAQYKFSARAAIIDGERKSVETLIEQFRNLDGPVFTRRKAGSSNKGQKEPQDLTKQEREGGYEIPDFNNVPDEVLLTAVPVAASRGPTFGHTQSPCRAARKLTVLTVH